MALCLKVYGKALIKKNLIICIYGLQLGRGNNFEDMSANNSIFSPSVVWTSYFFFISNHFRLFSFQTYFNTCEKKLVLIGMAKSFGGGGGVMTSLAAMSFRMQDVFSITSEYDFKANVKYFLKSCRKGVKME